MQIYTDRIAHFQTLLKANQKKDRLYSVGRFVVMALALLGLYLSIRQGDFTYLYVAFGLLGLFVFLLFRHKEVRDQSRRYRAFIKINQDELDYLEGNLSAFADGSEFMDRDHLYAYDLDLFGPRSVFHHLNRTATAKGAEGLAREFFGPNLKNIPQKQEAVKELGADLKFRQNFQVEAALLEEDPALDRKLGLWLKEPIEKTPLGNRWLLYFFSAVSLCGLLYWLAWPTVAHFYLFAALGGVNLLLVGSQLKKIRKQQLHLNGLSQSLLMYGNLLALIENGGQQSEMLKGQRDVLGSETAPASKALQKLSRILNGFDQLNNPVGSLVMNALFLYHLHSLRALVKWKQAYSSQIHDWLEVVSVFDQLSSLGNFVYNHPEHHFPSVASAPVFRASEMGHPLIRSKKRVSNPLDFNAFSYVVLTGSNMSGKSTFLKTIGVNLLLAEMGAPVCAKSLEFFPFRLLTSMKMVDSIEKEESYFQAEVGRLKRIQNALKEGRPCLVLLDEILRGTNSDDKRKGTRLFMKKIAATQSLGVVATHDIDIADLAIESPETFAALYFESRFEKGELHFDYRLRKGVCTTPNATELMRSQGII